jgi:tetratricopeptide (TPR) repeat protein
LGVLIKNARIAIAVLLVLLIAYAVTMRAQSRTRAKRPASNANATSQQDAAFNQAVKLADDARNAGRLDDAVQLYSNALKIRPSWPDGWWYVGAIFYDKDLYAQARDAFANLADLEPKRGPVWGMLGLCEFQIGNYERAVIALQRGRSIGFDGNKELESVVRYHTAILYVKFEQFEIAYEILREFVQIGNNGPKIVEAFGLTILRMPLLPTNVPAEKREQVALAGQAGLNMAARRLDEARTAFTTLVERYPDDPNVHYSYGVFQLAQDADIALKEFQRTLELQPLHQPAMVQMAFEYLKRDQYNDALPIAEKAVQLAPKMYPARNVLGRVLLELGQTDRAVKELEEGVRLAPSSPEMHFALARAYTRAGRKVDADREREMFKTLQEKYRQQSDAALTGSSPTTNTEKPNPR